MIIIAAIAGVLFVALGYFYDNSHLVVLGCMMYVGGPLAVMADHLRAIRKALERRP